MYKDLVETYNINISDSQIPKVFLPAPGEADYLNGYIDRYFIQKVNDKNSFVFEVDNSTANSLRSNSYWKVVSIKWRIIGSVEKVINKKTGMITDNGVYNDNINEINKLKKDIPNIRAYLINPLQFYKGKVL